MYMYILWIGIGFDTNFHFFKYAGSFRTSIFRHVLGDRAWHGVFIDMQVCSPRSSSKKLHVCTFTHNTLLSVIIH